ncbi:MAG: hydroxymethylglutaryl-CoA lyase [Planctomycetota bacterium]
MNGVRITEVGPRDGLQHEKVRVSTDTKVAFIDMLSDCGVDEIEVSSFVPAKWIPQLEDASEVFARIRRTPGVLYSALVPNERGLDAALAANADKISVFVSATEGFSQRNTAGTIAEVLLRIQPVVRRAREARRLVRGYISCVVRCPYDGPVHPDKVASVASRLLEMGVDEIDLGDTIGAADSAAIDALYEGLAGVVSADASTLHLHDTSGRAAECAVRAAQIGVRSFDASAGGLGGCPYAPGSAGNVATETLVDVLAARGFAPRARADRLRAAGQWMRGAIASCPP